MVLRAGALGQRGDGGTPAPLRVPPPGARAALAAAVAAALVLGVVVTRDIAHSPLAAGQRTALVLLTVLGGWASVAAGMVARVRAPHARTGALMIGVGLAWLAAGLRWTPRSDAAVTVWAVLGWVWSALLAHLVLAFPDGRLEGRAARWLAGAAYVIALPVRLVWLVLADQRVFDVQVLRPAGCACPRSLISSGLAPSLATVISEIADVAVTVVGLGVCAVLVARWRRSSALQRRALTPVLAVALVTALTTALSEVAVLAGRLDLADALAWTFDSSTVLLPLAFLGGLLRTQLRGGAGLARLIAALEEVDEPRRLGPVLARALGDASLTVAYWLPEGRRYVDADGEPVVMPAAGSARAATEVNLDGRPVAALLHDASLAAGAGYVRAAGRAAALWLDRARLEAERNARMVELRESRARVVEAADAERRRIERDLHDGAQQRLAGLLLDAKLRRRALTGAGDAEALLDDLERGLAGALAELRALAAGILPPVLTDYGLPAAVEELAARSPVPVVLDDGGIGRLPARVEAGAYFLVAEALANVLKHAGAGCATVRLRRDGARLAVEVHDDGAGGADVTRGSGLRGLADRMAALGGTLAVESPPGAGTTLRAELPCAS